MRVVSTDPGSPEPSLALRLLGPLQVRRDGAALALPASRKLRALLGYLALSPQPVGRAQLCELLWDGPNDPRGELRWCLSKLRGLVDGPGRPRVETPGDQVRLDLGDCRVDAAEIALAARDGIAGQAPARLRALAALFQGEFLEDLEVDRSPAFGAWLTAQRRRFRGYRAAILEKLAATAAGDDLLDHLDQWRALAPFDLHVHAALFDALARRGRLPEGDQHLEATARLFEAEGLDVAALRDAWRVARARAKPAPAAPSASDGAAAEAAAQAGVQAARRASIAVMPFAEQGPSDKLPAGTAGALVFDVIARLAKLRSLFVIAQGTVFALDARRVGPEEAGRILNVDYVVGGSLRRQGDRLTVGVELTETRTMRLVWAEVFNQKADDALLVLDTIGNRIVSSIAGEIEAAERNRAILKPPNSLDAWEAHHRGLWHMYRFNRDDNALAQHFFRHALGLDPTFARAHAGLSFTHFQNAFQGWAPREAEVHRAFETAGQGLMADDRDPAAHWAMGRALWLRGSLDQAILELERTIDLSPNFALGHYTLSFVHSQGGDAEAAIGYADHSRQLSPFDPLLFGMLGSRAMALVRLKRFDEAAAFGVKAAARPNAHAHIQAIAAYCLALAGRLDEARGFLAAIRRAQPGYGVDDFLTAMQIAPDGAALFRAAADRIAAD